MEPQSPFLSAPVIVPLVAALAMLWPVWRIYARAGLPPVWSALVLVPYAGPVLALIPLAHRPWPNRPPDPPKRKPAKRRSLRQMLEGRS